MKKKKKKKKKRGGVGWEKRGGAWDLCAPARYYLVGGQEMITALIIVTHG